MVVAASRNQPHKSYALMHIRPAFAVWRGFCVFTCPASHGCASVSGIPA